MNKVFITGGDQAGWALDQDVNQIKMFYSLGNDCEIVDFPEDCDFIHSAWWESLYNLPLEILKSKYVLCNISNRPFNYLTNPKFSLLFPYIDRIISQSTEAIDEFKNMGMDSFYLPYTIDIDVFNLESNLSKSELRKKYNVPQTKYIIGNFHRDSNGSNLLEPKPQKGPDIFLEIIKKVWQNNKNIHILLAGPRRHWLRNQLERIGIPYTFVGQMIEGDDWNVNILKLNVINELYHLMDLTIVTSRWEGAPRTILEAAATKTKIISTSVGIAKDLLDTNCIYFDLFKAVQLIEYDINNNILGNYIEKHYLNLMNNYTVEGLRSKFMQLYSETLTCCKSKICKSAANDPLIRSMITKTSANLTIGAWHKFVSPPYGGGNQFMLALCKSLRNKGVDIIENRFNKKIDCYLINSVHFARNKFIKEKRKNKIFVVHRIDGPIKIYRGVDEQLDDLCYSLNRQLASMTILQSNYVLVANSKLGYNYVNPVIIKNAVDSGIFNRINKGTFSANRKINLISTSWSSNTNKGFDVYQWIDKNLNWEKYSYTFVGNTPVKFEHIQVIDPVNSEQLAEILKKHDIYITASKNDPCSNALIEALACGLPAIYLISGGHPEIVGWGGLGFREPAEIPELLETIINNYESFQNLITIESIDRIAQNYYEVLKIVSQSSKNKKSLFHFFGE